MTFPKEMRVLITRDDDVIMARQKGRELAAQVGFSGSDLTLIVTAISEIARNIVFHARKGEIVLCAVSQNELQGVLVVADDNGPGISDLETAMEDGFSTGKLPGFGLSGARRLMDEFEIISEAGRGTTITMKKWMR